MSYKIGKRTRISDSTTSSSTTTGALVVTGGVGIGGALFGTSLSMSNQITSTLASGTAPFVVASTTNVANLNASTLSGATFVNPGPIGSTTASTGAFTTLTSSGVTTLTNNTASLSTGTGALVVTGGVGIGGALFGTSLSMSGQITSTLASGTPPFVVASTTNIPNLNASTLSGATFASPGAIGSTTPSTGAFTTLTSSGVTTLTNNTASSSSSTGALVVTGGVGIGGALFGTSLSMSGQITSTLASGTPPFVVASTTNIPNLNASTLSGATFASPGAIGSTTPSTGAFTTLTSSGITTITNNTASSSTGTGALVVTGGVGIGGALFGTTSSFNNNMNLYTPSIIGEANIRLTSNINTGGTIIPCHITTYYNGINFGGTIVIDSNNNLNDYSISQTGASFGIQCNQQDEFFWNSRSGGSSTQIRRMTLNNTGVLSLTSSTASTTNSAGAVVLAGGLSISNTTEATSSTVGGTITTAGGLAVAKKAYIGSDLIVSGGIYNDTGSGYNFSYRNKLINGAMMIDQRNAGAVQTIGASLTYTIDRWAVSRLGANVTCQRIAGTNGNLHAFRITGATSNTGTSFGQKIESFNSYDLINKSVVVSLRVSSTSITNLVWTANYPNVTDTWGAFTQIATGNLTITNTDTSYFFTFNAGANVANGIELVFSTTNLLASQSITYQQIQLELGTIPTAFERIPRTIELNNCYRYFVAIGGTNYCRIGAGYYHSANVYYFIPVAFTGRTPTSVSSVGTMLIVFGNIGTTTIILEAASTHNSITLQVNVSGANAGSFSQITANNDPSVRLYINAEL